MSDIVRNEKFNPVCVVLHGYMGFVVFTPSWPVWEKWTKESVFVIAWVDMSTPEMLVRFRPVEGDLMAMLGECRNSGGFTASEFFHHTYGSMPVNVPTVADVLIATGQAEKSV